MSPYLIFLSKITLQAWLVWLSGLSAGLRTERSPVRFPVRARAWVVGQVPAQGRVRGNQLMYLLYINVSLPPFLPPFLPPLTSL